jgi:hypothetical protein
MEKVIVMFWFLILFDDLMEFYVMVDTGLDFGRGAMRCSGVSLEVIVDSFGDSFRHEQRALSIYYTFIQLIVHSARLHLVHAPLQVTLPELDVFLVPVAP